MQSGISVTGAIPPCFRFWQDYEACLSTADRKSECLPQIEDYRECATKNREHARAVQIRTQYTQNLQKEGRSKSEIAASLKAGIPVSVGLIDRSKLAVVEGNGSDRIDPVNGREERERLGKEREKRESGSA